MGIKLGGDYDDTQREGVTVADISLSVGGGGRGHSERERVQAQRRTLVCKPPRGNTAASHPGAAWDSHTSAPPSTDSHR